jgi:cellulose synthase operon protein YhjU
MEQHPFWKGFDLLLSRFNTVTSYSNPSGIRLLRSKCGQPPHGDLYTDAPEDCYLLEGLRSADYTTFAAFNHDGEYGHFREQLTRFGHIDPPMSLDGLPVMAYDFDGSKIYDDFAVLEQWWERRQRSGVRRAALYYNTVILHDGAHQAGDPEWWKRDRVEQYRTFLGKLLTDFDRFFDRVASSGRSVLIVFIPEHGMALLGGPYQAPGLREIPLPRITEVPVGLKWIHGSGTAVPAPPMEFAGLTSYSSVAFLIGGLLRDNASAQGGEDLPRLLKEIPTLPAVMENEKVRVVQRGADYWVESRATGARWGKLRAER